jgi:hypothetical protein
MIGRKAVSSVGLVWAISNYAAEMGPHMKKGIGLRLPPAGVLGMHVDQNISINPAPTA